MTTHVVDFAPLAYCQTCVEAHRVPRKGLDPPFPETCPVCGGPIHRTAQVPFWESAARIPFFVGAAGSGKTMLGANKHFAYIIESGRPGIVYTPLWNKHMLLATLPAYMEVWDKYPKELHAGPYHVTEKRLPIRTKHGNVVDLWFRSIADDPTSLRGPTLGSAHGDEICDPLMKQESFRHIDQRLRGPLPAGMRHQHILTGTPTGVAHWTYDDFGDPYREEAFFERRLSKGDSEAVAREKAKWFVEARPLWKMEQYENIYLDEEEIQGHEDEYGDTPFGQQELHAEWIVAGEGTIFQPEWFLRYDDFPDNVRLVVDSWDTAQTRNEWSTYTVSQTWLITDDDHYYLVHMDRMKLQYAEVEIAIEGRQKLSGGSFALIEDKGSGQIALQRLRAKGVRVRAFKPGKPDKTLRANDAGSIVREGRVHLPSYTFARRKKMDWLPAFEREVFQVPYNRYFDIVDAFSQMILWGEAQRWKSRLRNLPQITTRIGHGVRVAV